MKKLLTGTIAVVVAFAVMPVARAGEYAEALSRCLVESTTAADREDLVRWIFAAASAHPAVSSVVSVDEEQRASSGRVVAGLFVRLLAEDCRDQTKAALAVEGEAMIERSFQALGELAGLELFQHPRVNEVVGQLQEYLDAGKLEAAFGPGG